MRVLVVEDDPRWREELSDFLLGLGKGTVVEPAEDEAAARRQIAASQYDLVIVDIALRGDPTDPRQADERGLDLIAEIRRSSLNRGCAVIVVTGYATERRYNRALHDLGVYRVMIKQGRDNQGFDGEELVNSARAAILESRIREAEERHATCYKITVSFNQEGLVGSELAGPTSTAHFPDQPLRFDWRNLVRRADNLDLFFNHQDHKEVWRSEVKDIGESLYAILQQDPQILGNLVAAGALAGQNDFWLRFRGPAAGLGIPFDLLRSGSNPLCLECQLTRQIVHGGAHFSHKGRRFDEFVETLYQEGAPLRVLIVAANCDGKIPGVNKEARRVAKCFKENLDLLGLAAPEVSIMTGRAATYSKVYKALEEKDYHIFHYAGHGRYGDTLPEAGGLPLLDGKKIRELKATDLNLLCKGKSLRLVFLSSCVGARQAVQPGRGDFHGVFEALAEADVPIVLGHRWMVSDDQAGPFAEAFYDGLWRTLSPAAAMLRARRSCNDRDDPTWASPVLLMQSS